MVKPVNQSQPNLFQRIAGNCCGKKAVQKPEPTRFEKAKEAVSAFFNKAGAVFKKKEVAQPKKETGVIASVKTFVKTQVERVSNAFKSAKVSFASYQISISNEEYNHLRLFVTTNRFQDALMSAVEKESPSLLLNILSPAQAKAVEIAFERQPGEYKKHDLKAAVDEVISNHEKRAESTVRKAIHGATSIGLVSALSNLDRNVRSVRKKLALEAFDAKEAKTLADQAAKRAEAPFYKRPVLFIADKAVNAKNYVVHGRVFTDKTSLEIINGAIAGSIPAKQAQIELSKYVVSAA